MDPKAVAAVEQHAGFIRGLIEGTLDGPLADVEFNSRLSFGNEVLAAQANLLAERLRERRLETTPDGEQPSQEELVKVIMEDVAVRAQLRRLRGDD